MKHSGLILGMLFASMTSLFAQVSVEVVLEQDQFLPGESVKAAVRISNVSGQTLKLGDDEHWLRFSVESPSGPIAIKTGEVPVEGEFILQSSERATKRVDLAPYFNLKSPGRYTVSATLYVKQWSQAFTSPRKPFDVIEGSKLWEREVGVPKAPGDTNSAPEIRKFALQEANYLRKHLMLYVRLTDSKGSLNKVYPLGRMLSFSYPQPEIDRFSNLHVLYQSGPHSYSYIVVNIEGDVMQRDIYDINPNSRPKLIADQDGNYMISGGTRRMAEGSAPAPNLPDSNATTPAR